MCRKNFSRTMKGTMSPAPRASHIMYRVQRSPRRLGTAFHLTSSTTLLLWFCIGGVPVYAQDAGTSSALPDAPIPAAVKSGTDSEPVAPITRKYIADGWQAQTLTARDKLNLTAHDLYTPQSFFGFAFVAGYSQLINGVPNYGTDRGAYGQRLGAAAIRDTSQDVLQSAVYSTLFHQDPRYYREGDGYSIPHRTLYALTRAVVTRGDNGHHQFNTSLLLGYATAAALTATYYPKSDRNAHDVGVTFATSIRGAALGFVLHEFMGDLLKAAHLQQFEQRQVPASK